MSLEMRDTSQVIDTVEKYVLNLNDTSKNRKVSRQSQTLVSDVNAYVGVVFLPETKSHNCKETQIDLTTSTKES